MTGITMDGIAYDVHAIYGTLKRSFSFTEGPNGGPSVNGTEILDTIGTKYGYSVNVEPNPLNPAGYDAFYEAISNPNRVHEITMPYGQTSLTFKAMISGGSDTYQGINAGAAKWDGLTVEFVPMYPQILR